jgi:hypothetical protein
MGSCGVKRSRSVSLTSVVNDTPMEAFVLPRGIA